MNKEKINKLDEKIKQLQAQKNLLLAREKEKERKERTKRLIQIGAIFESIGIDTLDKANLLKNEFDEKYNYIDKLERKSKKAVKNKKYIKSYKLLSKVKKLHKQYPLLEVKK